MLGGGKALGLCPPGFEDSDMAVIEAGTDLTTMHETDPRKILGAAPAGPRRRPQCRKLHCCAWGPWIRSGPGSDRVEIAVQGLGVPVSSHFEEFSPPVGLANDPPLLKGQIREEIGVFLLTGGEILIRDILKAQELPQTARPNELALALETFGIFPEEPPRLGVIL